ncbi:MAG: hypothetical protein ACLSB9_12635 [Hydrogeniiclostridium mannosilyticum]
MNYALEGCGFRSFCIEVKEFEDGREGRAVQAAIKGNGLGGFIRLLKFGYLLKKNRSSRIPYPVLWKITTRSTEGLQLRKAYFRSRVLLTLAFIDYTFDRLENFGVPL